MESLNDIIAEFHRKQTEMSALVHLLEGEIKARDEKLRAQATLLAHQVTETPKEEKS